MRYKCNDCGHEWETNRNPKRPQCSKCKSYNVTKVTETTTPPPIQDPDLRETLEEVDDLKQQLKEAEAETALALKQASQLKKGSSKYLGDAMRRFCVDCEKRLAIGAEGDRCPICQRRIIREAEKNARNYCVDCGKVLPSDKPHWTRCPRCYARYLRVKEAEWEQMNRTEVRDVPMIVNGERNSWGRFGL